MSLDPYEILETPSNSVWRLNEGFRYYFNQALLRKWDRIFLPPNHFTGCKSYRIQTSTVHSIVFIF